MFELNLDSNILDNKTSLDENKIYDILIVGAGPAGLNSALYGKRNGLDVGLIAKQIGGQVMDTSSVDNYLGYDSMSGESLTKVFKDHVTSYDIPIKIEYNLEKIEKKDNLFYHYLSDGSVFKSKTFIIATGSKPRKLNVSGEDDYVGKGVAYCAICDGPLYKDKVVAVVGGGNAAVEAALDLSKIAKKVVIIQRSEIKAEQILIDKLYAKENVTLMLDSQVKEIYGDTLVKGLKLYNTKKTKQLDLKVDGVFVQIGSIPNSDPFKSIVKTLRTGEIEIDSFCNTSEKGVFAAGDVTNVPYKQISIASGEGAKAALSASAYINKLEK